MNLLFLTPARDAMVFWITIALAPSEIVFDWIENQIETLEG